jgi:hypothetical protein
VVGTECDSGVCADGYCCDQVCDGLCERCNDLPFEGACRPTAQPLSWHTRCEGAGDFEPGPCVSCDGVNGKTCVISPVGTVCDQPSCQIDQRTLRASLCDAAGKCEATPTPCAPYNCMSLPAPAWAGCGTSCESNGDCAPKHLCESGACVPPPPRCEQGELIALDGTRTPCAPYGCGDTGAAPRAARATARASARHSASTAGASSVWPAAPTEPAPRG